MKRSDEKVFLVVKESRQSLSGLYSTWAIGSEEGNATELEHMLNTAATMRRAEALVTGEIHREAPCGRCFGLMRKYTEHREAFRNHVNAERVLSCSERPSRESSANMHDQEAARVGLRIGEIGLSCFAFRL